MCSLTPLTLATMDNALGAMPEQLMMTQLPGATPMFGHGNHDALMYGSSPQWRSSQDITACPTVELRSVLGISPKIDCGSDQTVCAEHDEPQQVIPDLLLCECAERCLLDPACTVMVYREERMRAYGLGSQCVLHSSCESTQKRFSEKHCSFVAAVTHGDELAARIEQLHGQLGVFPTALQAEVEVLAVQLRLQSPPATQLSEKPMHELPKQCEPPWNAGDLPSSWPEQSGLVASWAVHSGPTKNDSESIGSSIGSNDQDGCEPSRPLLAILVPVTSRHTNTSLGIESAPLLQILVPSLLRTLYLSNDTAAAAAAAAARTAWNPHRTHSDSLDYVLMIGFDEGDAAWDTPDARQKLPGLVQAAAHRLASQARAQSMRSNRSSSAALRTRLSVMLHRCSGNESGSMVKATNCLARRAFEIGAEWSYRLNDDSWLQTPNWATALTHALAERSHRALPALMPRHVNISDSRASVGKRRVQQLHEQAPQRPVLGVVGPFCPDGKQWTEGGQVLLVMDLVHRTHYEIFGYHYPEVFSNWWCDDWISLVYADSNLDLAHRVGKGKALVRHFIGAGQGGHQAETRTARYSVDFTQANELHNAVEEGRRRIAEWLQLASAS